MLKRSKSRRAAHLDSWNKGGKRVGKKGKINVTKCGVWPIRAAVLGLPLVTKQASNLRGGMRTTFICLVYWRQVR